MPTSALDLLAEGDALERLGAFDQAWDRLARAGELKHPPHLPLWGGPGSPGSALLVKRRIRHLGAELRNARFAAMARAYMGSVTVATEARLLPLLERSFPEVEYVDVAVNALRDLDCESSYERLATHFAPSEQAIVNSFRPLVPPPNGDPAGFGIAWHSVNGRKDLPSLDDWGQAVSALPGPVTSLQYDEIDAGIEQIEAAAKRPIARSRVDQKIDIDGFAGSVASVRGVLTISNTTAHMAGALGTPCVVMLDDLDHLSWPANRDRTPFYPSVRLVRRDHRKWQATLAEAVDALRHLMRTERTLR